MKNPFNRPPVKLSAGAFHNIDEANGLNKYRFTKYVSELQQYLKDAHIKLALGTVASVKMLELSQQLVPAVSSDGVLSMPENKDGNVSIPLWFADESIKVDYFPALTKDPVIKQTIETNVSDDILEKIKNVCTKEFSFGLTMPSGYTLEHNGQPMILVFSGLFGANMASTMCHELVHTWQILDRKFDDADDGIRASGELEAYHYQALFEKGLQRRSTTDYSIYGLSGIAQKINFIRASYAKPSEPYEVTPRMKRELIARGLGSAVFPSLREHTT